MSFRTGSVPGASGARRGPWRAAKTGTGFFSLLPFRSDQPNWPLRAQRKCDARRAQLGALRKPSEVFPPRASRRGPPEAEKNKGDLTRGRVMPYQESSPRPWDPWVLLLRREILARTRARTGPERVVMIIRAADQIPKKQIPNFGVPVGADFGRNPRAGRRKTGPKRTGPSARDAWDPFLVRTNWVYGQSRPKPGPQT
jgi:hypothetical protein